MQSFNTIHIVVLNILWLYPAFKSRLSGETNFLKATARAITKAPTEKKKNPRKSAPFCVIDPLVKQKQKIQNLPLVFTAISPNKMGPN